MSPLFVPLMSLSNNFAAETEVLEVGIGINPGAKSFLHASFEAVAWFWECCVVSCEQALGGRGVSKGTSPGHYGLGVRAGGVAIDLTRWRIPHHLESDLLHRYAKLPDKPLAQPAYCPAISRADTSIASLSSSPSWWPAPGSEQNITSDVTWVTLGFSGVKEHLPALSARC